MPDRQMLLVAGYSDVEVAEAEFRALADKVASKKDRAPYAFTGTVRNVVFDLAPHAHDEELTLHESTAQAALAHGAAG